MAYEMRGGEICKFELVLAFSFWQSAALALS